MAMIKNVTGWLEKVLENILQGDMSSFSLLVNMVDTYVWYIRLDRTFFDSKVRVHAWLILAS